MIQAFIQDKMRRLHEIRAEPEAVAGGVAIGMFMGFTPFVGFKTLLALLIAWLARCSKMAAIIAVTLHDIGIVIAPVMVWLEFKIGSWILQRPPFVPKPRTPGHSIFNFWAHWDSFFNWEFFHNFVIRVLIGSIVIGLPFAIASYFVTHSLLTKMRRRRLEAEEAAHLAGAAIDPKDI